MIDEEGKRLWGRVCETVRRLGSNLTPEEWRAQYETSWDYEPSLLDLHGMTVREAYAATRQFIAETTHREVIIVTGLSGQIREEFPEWIALSKRVQGSTILNGGGAFRIRLR